MKQVFKTTLMICSMIAISLSATAQTTDAKAIEIAAKRLALFERSNLALVEIIDGEKANLKKIKGIQNYQENVVTIVLGISGFMTPDQSTATLRKLVPILKGATQAIQALVEGRPGPAMNMAFAYLIQDPELRKLLGLDKVPVSEDVLAADLLNPEAITSAEMLSARLDLLRQVEVVTVGKFQDEANEAVSKASGLIFLGWSLERQSEALIKLYETQQVFLVAKIAVLKSFLNETAH